MLFRSKNIFPPESRIYTDPPAPAAYHPLTVDAGKVLMSTSHNLETTRPRSTAPTPANRERRERVYAMALDRSRHALHAPLQPAPHRRDCFHRPKRPRLADRMLMSMRLTTLLDNRERRERVSPMMPGKSGHALRPTSTPSGNDAVFFTNEHFLITQTIDSIDEQPA